MLMKKKLLTHFATAAIKQTGKRQAVKKESRQKRQTVKKAGGKKESLQKRQAVKKESLQKKEAAVIKRQPPEKDTEVNSNKQQ